MEIMLLIVHILVSFGLIGLILIQQGKGAEVGASFGSGASQTIFGSQGSGSFLTRATSILVTVFFITSLALGYLATHHTKTDTIDALINKFNQTESPADSNSTHSKGGHQNQSQSQKQPSSSPTENENPLIETTPIMQTSPKAPDDIPETRPE